MTRWAVLMPLPVTLSLPLRSGTRETGPLWMPIRSLRRGWPPSARATSAAHWTGASGSRKKTSAMPSPVSSPMSLLPLGGAGEFGGAAHDRAQFLGQPGLFLHGQAGVARHVQEQHMGDFGG